VDRRTVQKRSVARQDPVRTTIAAAGTETTGLSNPGVCYIINTHESFNRIIEQRIAVMEVPAELDLLSRAKDYIRGLGE
jgi:hypothetical protein